MSDGEARERIVKAVQELLQEGCAAEDITVRQIAGRAGVGIGTVSYHFHSKEKLLFDAVGQLMNDLAITLIPPEGSDGTATQRLRAFLLGTAELAVRYYDLCKIQLSYDIVQGDFSICYYILPLLREIFGPSKSELEIKLVAVQLITAMQSVFLRREAFQRYCGLDIRIKAQREEALDIILNSNIN